MRTAATSRDGHTTRGTPYYSSDSRVLLVRSLRRKVAVDHSKAHFVTVARSKETQYNS